MLRVAEPRICNSHGLKAPDHEARAHEEHECEGDLTDNEHVPGAVVHAGTVAAAPTFLQSADQIQAPDAQNWKQAEQDAGKNRQADGESKHRGVDRYRVESREIGRRHCRHETQAAECEREPAEASQ